MKDFNELKKEGRIKSVSIDKSKAKGLLKRSKRRFENQKQREIDPDTAFEVLENVYESVRESIEAGMAADGYSSDDHVSVIAYSKEKLFLDRSEINKLHKFRKLRNKSRYEAKDIKRKEAEDIISFAKDVLPKIRNKVQSKL